MFGVIFEHNLTKVRADDFGEGFSAQYLTDDVLLCSDCHFTHGVVVERVVSETFSFVDFTLFEIALQETGCAFFDHVEGGAGISLFDDVLSFIVLEGDEGGCYFLLLLWSQKLVEGHRLEELLV